MPDPFHTNRTTNGTNAAASEGQWSRCTSSCIGGLLLVSLLVLWLLELPLRLRLALALSFAFSFALGFARGFGPAANGKGALDWDGLLGHATALQVHEGPRRGALQGHEARVQLRRRRQQEAEARQTLISVERNEWMNA